MRYEIVEQNNKWTVFSVITKNGKEYRNWIGEFETMIDVCRALNKLYSV